MITIDPIKDLVQDKRILLVGNNDTIKDVNLEEIIKDYDVIVKMNHATELAGRTDIWLCSFNNEARQIKQYPIFNPRCVIRLNADGSINDAIKGNLYIWDKIYHTEFKSNLGALPSTGIMAIHFFLEFTYPKSLTLIGFDNFESKTYYNTKKIAHNWHDIDREAEYTNKLINEGRIIKL